MKYLILFFILSTAHADVESEVFVKGKVSGTFDDKQVKVIDSLGQTFFLPREAFPKDFVMKDGAPFAMEIDDKLIKDVKLFKKKK